MIGFTSAENASDEENAVPVPMARAHGAKYTRCEMQPLRARVHNGRLVLDEPTDLPEGEVVELVPLAQTGVGDEDAAADLVALGEELDQAIAEADAGETVDFALAIAELRQRP